MIGPIARAGIREHARTLVARPHGATAGGDPRRAIMMAAAIDHRDAALPHVAGDDMGAHWLAPFAALASPA